jgi:serine phosphatase RsbU (regulator of sigma subunit)/predicted metal-dependent HD superfamily phosphohydrolase
MSRPDFDAARQYVFARLEQELAPTLYYHCIAHTRDEVLPAVERLAALEGLADAEALLLLRTAALYHDIGFVETTTRHEQASARLAAETLPQFGYSQQQISRIQQMIQATALPQSPETPLAQLLADADLDVLGREDFLPRNRDMYRETGAGDGPPALEAWYRSQLKFLQLHQYFTKAARSLRQPGKQRNIETLEALLAGLAGSPAAGGAGLADAQKLRAVLARVPLFQRLPPQEIEFLAGTLQSVALGDGGLLFQEEERGDSFYVVVEGSVEIVKAHNTADERLIGLRGPGEFIGEMSLFLPDGRRTASARSAGPSRLLQLTRADFDRLLQRQPYLALEFIQVLSARLSVSHNRAIQDLQAKNRRLSDAYEALQAAQAELIVKERLERELQVAAEIQRSILPGDLPRLPGYDFGALIVPAKEVGGDFYDWIPLDDGRLGIVVGDITDKGVPAAIFMAQTHALLRAAASPARSPRETLDAVNRHLLDMNRSGMFATILYGILEAATGRFAYARAGHDLPLWRRPDGTVVLPALGAGLPLGLFPGAAVDEQTILLEPGTVLLLYTDGATDALIAPAQSFGLDGLSAAVRQAAPMPAQDLCQFLYSSLTVPEKPDWKVDDITLVAVQRA